MMDLKKGMRYLLMTKKGQVYFGKFVNCERKEYCNSKRESFMPSKKRLVDVFENVHYISIRGNPSFYNYLHLLTSNLKNAVEVDFGESKFLNMPESEILKCFRQGLRDET